MNQVEERQRSMMAEFRWIKMSLFLILMLQFTAVTGHEVSYLFVRDGDDVTLPCENVINDQDKCDKTTWIFNYKTNPTAAALFELGQIHNDAKSKSDRLSVTEKCSLVIKKVKDEDVGRYTCRQFNKSGKQQGEDTQVHLSVVSMTEEKNNDMIKLFCSVLTREECRYTVKWLYEGEKDDFTDMVITPHSCSSTVTFTTSDLNQTSKNYELLKCKVTDIYNKKVQLFPFRPQSSREETGEDRTTVRTKLTTTTTKISTSENATTATHNNDPTKPQRFWWLYIIVAVVLATLLVSVVAFIRLKKTKGNKIPMDGDMELSFNPAVTQSGPETSQDMADPEVSYASISCFTKETKCKARKNDEGDAVTYSTVKASSSSVGLSTDPSNLYATINKPADVYHSAHKV